METVELDVETEIVEDELLEVDIELVDEDTDIVEELEEDDDTDTVEEEDELEELDELVETENVVEELEDVVVSACCGCIDATQNDHWAAERLHDIVVVAPLPRQVEVHP